MIFNLFKLYVLLLNTEMDYEFYSKTPETKHVFSFDINLYSLYLINLQIPTNFAIKLKFSFPIKTFIFLYNIIEEHAKYFANQN